MKIKGSKVAGGSWTTLGLPLIFLLCLFFFLAGFFGASLFSQQVRQLFSPSVLENSARCVNRVEKCESLTVCVRQEGPTGNLRPRTRELVEEVMDLMGIPHGDSGRDSVETIPVQVCSSAS